MVIHKVTTNIRMTRKSLAEDIQRLIKIKNEGSFNEKIKELLEDWLKELYKIYEK